MLLINAAFEEGSSPLTRGKHPHVDGRARQSGLIPTHAGKTAITGCLASRIRAHPHSRGENSVSRMVVIAESGSSPLTRGKPLNIKRAMQADRLIPTHAGKTPASSPRRSPARAHPHSRGENEGWEPGGGAISGSSPLTRGKHEPAVRAALGARLIPTHAGKTTRPDRFEPGKGAHPHSRGENVDTLAAADRRCGSSPLTRGKPVVERQVCSRGGLIPTHAGKTHRKIELS